jgi:hypothetical protein
MPNTENLRTREVRITSTNRVPRSVKSTTSESKFHENPITHRPPGALIASWRHAVQPLKSHEGLEESQGSAPRMQRRIGLNALIPRMAAVLVAAIGFSANASCAESLCSTLTRLETKGPLGLAKYAVEEKIDESGEFYQYLNVDIDHDGTTDRLTHTCRRGGGEQLTDPCTLTIEIGGSEETYELTRLWLYVIRYKDKLYVVSSVSEQSDDGMSIFLLSRQGVKQVCRNIKEE